MKSEISETLMPSLAGFIEDRTGLSFPPKHWKDLERRFIAASCHFGFENAESCFNWLLSSSVTREQIEILARSLTIGETYFFRESKSWDFFEQHILKEYIRAYQSRNRRLRIWVAGCSTGEEPYTIAILLDHLIPEPEEWNITILATDINSQSLQKAEKGVYSERAFRETPGWVRDRYFKNTGDRQYRIIPSIRNMVTYSFLNLAEDTYPSLMSNTTGMDIIFCRNVLMYFSGNAVGRILQSFSRSLVDRGVLLVSVTEQHLVKSTDLVRLDFDGTGYFRKSPAGSRGMPEKETETPSTPVCRAGSPEGPAEKRVETPPPAGSYAEAERLFRAGQFSRSSEMLKTIMTGKRESHTSSGRESSLMARNLANLGRLYDALQWIEKALAEDRTNSGFHYLQAVILMELGSRKEAAGALKRTLYLDFNSALAHYTYGNLLRNEGNFRGSVKQYRNALEILSGLPAEEVLQDAEGLTAGRLVEIISAVIEKEAAA